MDDEEWSAASAEKKDRPYPEALLEVALGLIRRDLRDMSDGDIDAGKVSRYTEVLLAATKKGVDDLMKMDGSSAAFWGQMRDQIPDETILEWADEIRAKARAAARRP